MWRRACRLWLYARRRQAACCTTSMSAYCIERSMQRGSLNELPCRALALPRRNSPTWACSSRRRYRSEQSFWARFAVRCRSFITAACCSGMVERQSRAKQHLELQANRAWRIARARWHADSMPALHFANRPHLARHVCPWQRRLRGGQRRECTRQAVGCPGSCRAGRQCRHQLAVDHHIRIAPAQLARPEQVQL